MFDILAGYKYVTFFGSNLGYKSVTFFEIFSYICSSENLNEIKLIMSSIIDGDMRAPNRKTFKSSSKPKKVNLERFLTIDEMFSLTINEHRLINYFIISKAHKKGIDDGEQNQLIKYSYAELKEYIPNKKSFYAAISRLIELDIIERVPGQPSMFRFNPLCISNLTQEQAVRMGVIKANLYNNI